MCGIAGYQGMADHWRPPTVLERMLHRLRHRGPDSSGMHVDAMTSLGCTRLAIVGLRNGEQPIRNETGGIWVACNGEIFDHQQHRRALESLGHRFLTDSDTEVIVHAYEQYGDDFIQRLNGQFAIALWDRDRERLLLIRDRLGIHPLYYAALPHGLVFASEIKAILATPEISTRLDPRSIADFLCFKNSIAPATIYATIRQLEPGSCAEVRKGRKSRQWQYWRPQFAGSDKFNHIEACGCHAPARRDENGPARHLTQVLERAVARRLVADVDVGAYLSGGLDSSLLVAIAARMRGRGLKTFTLCYDDPALHKGKHDDEAWARRLSRSLGTEHYEQRLTPAAFFDGLRGALAAFDEPFGGAISTWYLSSLICKHVKVAISGDGADELFGSYRAHRVAAGVESLADIEGQPPHVWRQRIDPFDSAMALSMLAPDLKSTLDGYDPADHYRRLYASSATTEPLNQTLDVDLRNLLPNQVLAFVDRLSMAHAVEVRVPYLDHEFVDAVTPLTSSHKINGGITKRVLREMARPYLPAEVIDRPKEGFVQPSNAWLQTSTGIQHLRDALNADQLKQQGVFDARMVQQLLSEHEGGRSDHASRLWLLYVYQLWDESRRSWMEGADTTSAGLSALVMCKPGLAEHHPSSPPRTASCQTA